VVNNPDDDIPPPSPVSEHLANMEALLTDMSRRVVALLEEFELLRKAEHDRVLVEFAKATAQQES
jgi:hypothetical protein